MALFGNNQSDDSPPPMANQSSTVQDQVNLVGEGTLFEGTIKAESDVRCSGRIVGTLEVEGKAMIAENGSVEGEIISTNADVAGTVQGEIHVEERLVLKSTAEVDGKIETDRLVVEEGAQFTGECEMGTSVSTTASTGDDGFGTGVGDVDENDARSEEPATMSAGE